ncbi:MAG: hypothetical protein HYY15_04630 [Candidatus Omnitrophica bacterium]|nr:hypothetical protein [Candidatus Omnitrophota bacterium]
MSPETSWHVVAHDEPTASAQMAYDQASALARMRMFRAFRWARPAISLGWKQPQPAWLQEAAWSADGIEVVERPTGGGIAVHGSDLSCSVVVPAPPSLRLHELLASVGAALAQGLDALGVPVEWVGEVPASQRVTYCLAERSSYALMARGRKLCGLAVRRFPGSLLVQGSMLVGGIPEAIARALPDDARRAYEAQAITIEAAAGRAMDPEAVRQAVLDGWQRWWGERGAADVAVTAHAV